MSIAISEDHRSLADTASDFLAKHGSRAAARSLLEGAVDELPDLWQDLVGLGWLGLHVPEEHGGSGFGVAELVIVVEQAGRALLPGPFVPTAIASAVLVTAGTDEARTAHLRGLAEGSTTAAVALTGAVEVRDGTLHGSVPVAVGGGIAGLAMVPMGDDVAIVELSAAGVTVTVPQNLDPTRPAARLTFDGAAAQVLPGARRALIDLSRTIFAAEATGVARECTEMAAAYAKERKQFGRVIATFQAVKHHCADMLVAAELATAAVWDAARAADSGDADKLHLTAAMAATQAARAADLDANLSIQVHGGIGFTWEHDAHLYLRRATALGSLLSPEDAARDVTDLTRRGVRRSRSMELPPEAEAVRDEVRAFAEEVKGLDPVVQRDRLIDSGYVMPHWPKPWGLDADAVTQLVIEQEFREAGISRPAYGITGWVILTLIQHATEDQVARWVRPALTQEVIWCQLFSEPDAGSDAAAVKTRATRVDGGWLVNGQKVWTSGAHVSGRGFATVRTTPDVPKHHGITTIVIDMYAEGVQVRPLKMPSGGSEFNEVFFDDVFVPDDDVVGPVDGGWTVARATLGNESVSIGGGQGAMALPGETFLPGLDAHPERLSGGSGRVGRYIANDQAMAALNLRSAHRAVEGGGPGPEGNVTKLVLSENAQEAAAIASELAGPDVAYLDGEGAMAGLLVLMSRALSIAGGTSEIKRNQIGERILGLPRDPLIS